MVVHTSALKRRLRDNVCGEVRAVEDVLKEDLLSRAVRLNDLDFDSTNA